MPYKVEKIEASLDFGAVVRGLEEADIANPATRAKLKRLWIKEGLLIFRDSEISPSFQVSLSRVFGRLEPHAVREIWVDGLPELITLKYEPGDGTIYEIGGKLVGGWIPWHSDLVYVDAITHGGLLRTVTLPYDGGETGFIDQIEAYQRLPDLLKDRVEGLEIVYQMDIDKTANRYARPRPTRLVEFSDVEARIQARRQDYPPVVHPVVYRQPETGRKVLNVSPTAAQYILGMDDEEGHKLLDELVDHVTDERFAYFHRWSTDEMLLWDNWRMIHTACGVPQDAVREVQRTSIAGDYGLGCKLTDRLVEPETAP